MASRSPELRHVGVGASLALGLASGGFLLASLYRVPVPAGEAQAAIIDRRPVVTQTINYEPIPQANLYRLLALGCGLGAVAIAQVSTTSFSNDAEEVVELAIEQTYELTRESISLVTSWFSGKPKQVAKTLALKSLPAPIKNLLAHLDKDDWFQEFLKSPHNWVTGATGDGKSFLLLALLIQVIEDDPEAVVTICDRNYGKPQGNGKPNIWLGIPHQYIRTTPEEILGALKTELEELEKRETLCAEAAKNDWSVPKFQKRVLFISELDETAEELNGTDGTEGEFAKGVRTLLKKYRGYGGKVVLEGQSLEVGATDINRETRRQIAICMVGENCFMPDAVKEFRSGQTDQLIEDCRALRRSGKGYAPCLVKLPKREPQAKMVPNLKHIDNCRIIVELPADEQWWIDTFTPELQQWLQTLATDYKAGKIKSPLKPEIAPKFGVRVDRSDTRYANYVKPAWETALAQVQQPTGDSHESN